MTAAPFWWVQPLVVAAGVAISLVVALLTIRTNRRIARIKATLDLIESSETKEHYLELYRNYKKYRMDGDFRQAIIAAETEDNRLLQDKCCDFLNYYELVSIGFKEGILDERFYKRWMKYAVLRDYREGVDLIADARKPTSDGGAGDATAYCELEALCIKWGGRSVKEILQSRRTGRN
jgi:uncharacterized protein DUF4760